MTYQYIVVFNLQLGFLMLDMQNKKDLPGIEITLITADQTMSVQEEDILMIVAWSHG